MATVCFPPLVIPNKGWPRDTGLGDRAGEASAQAFRIVERWAAALPCIEEGGLPQAWCSSTSDTVSPEGSLIVDVTIDTTATQVIVIATFVITNIEGTTEQVDVSGYFRSAGSDLNSAVAFSDTGWSWPASATRTVTASCLVDAGASVGASIYSRVGSGGDISILASVQVLEVDGQSTSCCTQGG